MIRCRVDMKAEGEICSCRLDMEALCCSRIYVCIVKAEIQYFQRTMLYWRIYVSSPTAVADTFRSFPPTPSTGWRRYDLRGCPS